MLNTEGLRCGVTLRRGEQRGRGLAEFWCELWEVLIGTNFVLILNLVENEQISLEQPEQCWQLVI